LPLLLLLLLRCGAADVGGDTSVSVAIRSSRRSRGLLPSHLAAPRALLPLLPRCLPRTLGALKT
jgi:hypothetical protein